MFFVNRAFVISFPVSRTHLYLKEVVASFLTLHANYADSI